MDSRGGMICATCDIRRDLCGLPSLKQRRKEIRKGRKGIYSLLEPYPLLK